MTHLYVFYFIITFSIGAVSLGVTLTLYFRTRNKLLQYYLYFYTSFTLIVVLNMVLGYIRTNIPHTHLYLMETLNYLERPVALYLLMFTVPVFIHYFVSVPDARIRNIIVGCLAIFMLMGFHLFHALSAMNPTIGLVGDYLEDTIVVSVMLYCFIIGVIYTKKIQDSFKKQLSKKFLLVFGIFFPGIVNDTFLSEWSYIRFYPLLYCSFSLIFTYQFLKHHQELKYLSSESESTSMLPDDTFFEQHNISAREKDVIALIVQGYSNQQIGEDLCISLNTVKTHIRNIYQKFEINSRQELIALLNNHSPAKNDVAKPLRHTSDPDISS